MENESRDIRIAEKSLQECDILQETNESSSPENKDDPSISKTESGDNQKQKKRCHGSEPAAPLHDHEVQGLVETAQQGADAHNHRFLVISSEPKPLGEQNHVHEVIFCTDYHNGFCHEGWGTTSGAFPAGDGHVHFLEGITTTDDGHWHKYSIVTSLDGIFD